MLIRKGKFYATLQLWNCSTHCVWRTCFSPPPPILLTTVKNSPYRVSIRSSNNTANDLFCVRVTVRVTVICYRVLPQYTVCYCVHTQFVNDILLRFCQQGNLRKLNMQIVFNNSYYVDLIWTVLHCHNCTWYKRVYSDVTLVPLIQCNTYVITML